MALAMLTELRLLIFFLVAMQVQRENFQSPAAGYVVVTEIVVPNRPRSAYRSRLRTEPEMRRRS